MVRCGTLPILQPGQNAVNNHIESMRLFHLCANKVAGWIDWYGQTEGAISSAPGAPE